MTPALRAAASAISCKTLKSLGVLNCSAVYAIKTYDRL
jgi:hypothetical protein